MRIVSCAVAILALAGSALAADPGQATARYRDSSGEVIVDINTVGLWNLTSSTGAIDTGAVVTTPVGAYQSITGSQVLVDAEVKTTSIGEISDLNVGVSLLSSANTGSGYGGEQNLGKVLAPALDVATLGFSYIADDQSPEVDVPITVIKAGDADENLVIDSFDIQDILAANKFGTGTPGVWAEGDFNGDSVVDSFDIQAVLATALFGTGPYAAATPAVPGDGVVDLVVNPDGTAVMNTDGLLLNGFILQAEGLLTGAATLPGAVFSQNKVDIASAQVLFANLQGELDLGSLVADVAAFEAALDGVLFSYTVEGASGAFNGTITVVPEPMTMSLLALGGLAVLKRRRK